MPSLALTTLAALTPDPESLRANVEFTIVDEVDKPVDVDADCDIVGFTGYVNQISRMHELAAIFKAKGRLVIIGGPHPSLAPHRYRDYCDVLFTGEAEETWPRFLHDYVAGDFEDEYQAAPQVDITTSPVPRYDLIDPDRYWVGSVQTSRGCPFECEFCDVIVYLGRRQRHKTGEQLSNELDALYARGFRDVFLCDDNLTAHRGRAVAVLEAVRDWRMRQDEPVRFITQVSIDVARPQDQDLLDLCYDAGLRTAFVGIETTNEASLIGAKKRQNTRSNEGTMVEKVQRIHQRGIQVQAGLIAGFDQDDMSCFQMLFDFAQQAGIPGLAITQLNAPEATPLAARMAAEGRLLPATAMIAESGANFASNILPAQMTNEELSRGVTWLYNRLYHPDTFLERIEGLAAHLPDADSERGAAYGTTDMKRAVPMFTNMQRLLRQEGQGSMARTVLRQMRTKEINHVVFALTLYYNTIKLLDHWGIYDPNPPERFDPERPVTINRTSA